MKEAEKIAITERAAARGGAVKLVRTKSRVYPSEAHRKKRTHVASHAEYAVVDGDRTLVSIIFIGRKWIAVQGRGGNKFGLPVSPVNVTRLRDVEAWAIKRFRSGQ
jgi:hypothetical protein